MYLCENCGRENEHRLKCEECQTDICLKCVQVCEDCNENYCSEHSSKHECLIV